MEFIAQHCDLSQCANYLMAFPALIGAGVTLAAIFWLIGAIVRMLCDVMRG